MNADDARAFALSLAHREQAEGAASAEMSGSVVALSYKFDLRWPWPREFTYRSEYVAVGAAREVAEAMDARGELVVSLFHPDLWTQEEALEKLGLVRAWLSPLMGRDLAQDWPRPKPAPVGVREVVSLEDRERFNSVQGISNRSDSLDEHIHYLYVERDGEVVTKGQVIYLGEGTAYISDVFTVARARRRGFGTAMMWALEAKARELGAGRVVLAPGLEQIKIKLYERYGYACTAERAVLIRAKGDEVD